MAEYMSREDYCETSCGKENREGYKTCHNCSMLNVPSADVQPVKRGKWKYYKNNGIWDIHKCTVCNTPFELPMDVVASSVFCYCPHCGADMRGEKNAE